MKAIKISERPQVFTRTAVRGKPMLRVINTDFEQAVRDIVKAYEVDILGTDCRVEIYGRLGHYPIGVCKSVLDGLNGCAFVDDRFVKQLFAVNDNAANDCRIKVSSINEGGQVLNITVPTTPVAKREAFPQFYNGQLSENEMLAKRIDRTAELIRQQVSGTEDGELMITMVFKTDKSNNDIDNLAKYYLMAMERAGAINLH